VGGDTRKSKQVKNVDLQDLTLFAHDPLCSYQNVVLAQRDDGRAVPVWAASQFAKYLPD